MEAQSKSNSGYMPPLDGVRAIAIFSVMLAHYSYGNAHFERLDVILFFVLSGFLITGILVNARAQLDLDRGASRWGVIKSFYIRRSLRIFHFILIYMAVRFAPRIGLSPIAPGFTRVVVYSAITIVIASVTFYLFERPITALKRKFPYVKNKS